MRGRGLSRVPALLAAAVLSASAPSAQERSAPAGAVIVREVQVREVRVNQPPSSDRRDKRPSFGVERPLDPGVISRTPDSARSQVIRPPAFVGASRHRDRRDFGRHAFKPRFNTGFGVVVGYPIIYPYAYPYDPFSPTPGGSYTLRPSAPNTYSNVDSIYSTGSVTAASPLPAAIACEGSLPCGGVSFDIEPASAQIFVDGVFAGVVDDFDDSSPPLLLAPGDHYIELRLAGYRTASFDVTIVSGEVTPYQGALERLRLRRP